MKFNKITGEPFTILELSEVARNYYDNYRSGQLQSGFMLYVATDGEKTMFVNTTYDPENEDIVVFMCDVRSSGDARHKATSGTGVHLYKTYFDGPDDPALRSKAFRAMSPRWFKRDNILTYEGKTYRRETPDERALRKHGAKWMERKGKETEQEE